MLPPIRVKHVAGHLGKEELDELYNTDVFVHHFMLHSQKCPPSTVLLLCYHKLCTCVYSYLIIHNLVTVIMDISYSLVYFVAFNIFLNKFISHIFSNVSTLTGSLSQHVTHFLHR